MASDAEFVAYACGQIRLPNISNRKMFGEYAVYCGEKVVALVCDNQFFVKPTQANREFIGDVVEAAPFPGAKTYFLIDDQLDNPDFMTNLIALTERDIPLKKTKRKKG